MIIWKRVNDVINSSIRINGQFGERERERERERRGGGVVEDIDVTINHCEGIFVM